MARSQIEAMIDQACGISVDSVGKVGATGDEIQALNFLVDYSESWWKRQSGSLFADAFVALDKLRHQQLEAA